MRVGYIRVSSVGQNTARQKAGLEVEVEDVPRSLLQLEGADVQRIFEDHASGSTTDRPKLRELMDFVRDGDSVVVYSLDRLARNLMDLKNVIEAFRKKGVEIEFIKERLKFSAKKEGTPMENLLLNVMGSFAEFERAIIRERQAEGIAIAKLKGVYKGRVPVLTEDKALEMARRVAAGENKVALRKEYKISRMTQYRYIKSAAGKIKGKEAGDGNGSSGAG